MIEDDLKFNSSWKTESPPSCTAALGRKENGMFSKICSQLDLEAGSERGDWEALNVGL